MRRRILGVALWSVLIVVLLLGLPLGIVVGRLTESRERDQLSALALRTTVLVPRQSGDPVELPEPVAGRELAVYDIHGRREAGTGPDTLEAASRAALQGQEVSATTDGDIVQVVPVSANEHVYAVVRAAAESSQVSHQVWRRWAALLGLCVVAGLGAAAFAARASRRLATPVSQLAGLAERIGEGELAAAHRPTGVAEVDRVAAALEATGGRLSELLERERAFTRTASHQLRTPLTQLQLELEAGLAAGSPMLEQAAGSALESAEQLSRTIDEVLALARSEAAGERFDVVSQAAESAEEWHGALAAEGRPITVRGPVSQEVVASRAAVRQILQVLLDNALRHGRGEVTVTVREAHDAVAVDVTDRGSSAPAGWHHGLGLGLARSLAEKNGGRLLVASDDHGHPRVTLLLPAPVRPGPAAPA